MALLTNKYITIKTHIDGDGEPPLESIFELKTITIPGSVEPESNDIIVESLYISMDPYQINRMKKHSSSHDSFIAASRITPGTEINAFGVGRVVASGNPDYQKNDLVSGPLNWAHYTIIRNGNLLTKLDIMGFPLSYHVGILGTCGLTAYGGFFEVCKPKEGEKVFVSTASGAVGNLVGQYAKLLGCYVVGCAGSKQKVDFLKEKLGFDEAFNYKEQTDLKSTLQRYFPEGMDIYFDNVGGEMLEAAVANMKPFGRVAACGAISEYLDAQKRATPNMIDVIYKRITIRGFLCVDFMHLFKDFVSKTADYLRDGKLQVLEDISCGGVESIPSAFVGLFRGDNFGKKMVQIEGD